MDEPTRKELFKQIEGFATDHVFRVFRISNVQINVLGNMLATADKYNVDSGKTCFEMRCVNKRTSDALHRRGLVSMDGSCIAINGRGAMRFELVDGILKDLRQRLSVPE